MKMLAALATTIVIGTPSFAAAQTAADFDQRPYDRFQEFLDNTVRSPLWWIEIPAAGAIDQASNNPEEWQGGSGYAKRNVSSAVKVFAIEAIDHALAAPMHQRVTYDRCTCTGFARFGHAISRVFVAVDSRDGRLQPNLPLWVSIAGTAALANAWAPPSYTARDVAVSNAIGMGATAGIKVLKEFIRVH